MEFGFSVQQKKSNQRKRAGVIKTPHGEIQTPAFIAVGTQAVVKSLTPEQIVSTGAQAVLANTYHLYLEPGEDTLQQAGGLSQFMGWKGPTFTDSGGFQVFSLGAGFGAQHSKVAGIAAIKNSPIQDKDGSLTTKKKLVKVTEDGVSFRSYRDGSEHFFTPEKSIQIQNNIGADIIFAFDECTSPGASLEYQKDAMDRTHRWAARSLTEHAALQKDKQMKQALFGIVQGGTSKDLRKESAEAISKMEFDGFGIGGSYTKEDIQSVVGLVNDILPENKPRHLLGIGEPLDLLLGIEEGIDTFDCVIPTRLARHSTAFTSYGKINLLNAKFIRDFDPIEKECLCYTCKNFSKAYLAHLYRSQELLSGTLVSIHNLHFLIHLVAGAREAILNDTFDHYKNSFLEQYQ